MSGLTKWTDIQNVKAWTGGLDVEHEAINQIRNIASLPILAGHVAIMPDVHLGKGAAVGSVIPTKGAIIPAAVGVDIGCGMVAAQLDITANDLPDNLSSIRAQIEQSVPVGFNWHDDPITFTYSGGLEASKLRNKIKNLHNSFDNLKLNDNLGKIDYKKTWCQLGTLGGGNHFIELCLDENDNVWIMLHSGSRNIGNLIGTCAISMAKEIALKEDIFLPDKNLAWLSEGAEVFDKYVEALLWAQDYARTNRDIIFRLVLGAVTLALKRDTIVVKKAVNCHHNYSSLEDYFGSKIWITRKGAVSAKEGELGIIPGSMGTKSFIVKGKGNLDSYRSCSHGAGRRMSRSAAKKTFTLDDLKEQTKLVECRKDRGVLDEIPSAYKNIDEVMKAQVDLVDIEHELHQVLCVKG